MTIRVALIMPMAGVGGGAEHAFRNLIRHVPPDSTLAIFLEPGPLVDEASALGFDTHVIPIGRMRQVHRTAIAVAALAALLRKTRPDGCIAWMAKATWFAAPAGAAARVPVVWFDHGAGVTSRADRTIERIVGAMGVRALFAVSKGAAEYHRARWPKKPVKVVHPGVILRSPCNPNTTPSKRGLGLTDRSPVIGTVSRLSATKGIHFMIQAMPAVLQHHPDAHYIVVGGASPGEPDYPALLSRLSTQLCVEHAVSFVGHQDDVHEWLCAMDVFVNATPREPFGLAVVEAMAAGRPVVASVFDGPSEVITSGVNGLLVETNHPAQLAAAVNRYLSDPRLRRQISSAAIRRARDFDAVAFAERFLNAAAEVVAAK